MEKYKCTRCNTVKELTLEYFVKTSINNIKYKTNMICNGCTCVKFKWHHSNESITKDKRSSYNRAMNELFENRDLYPTDGRLFNSLVSGLQNRNYCYIDHMDERTADGRDSVARTLFRKEG